MIRPAPVAPLLDRTGCAAPGERALGLVRELYPICRSITGDGVRQTLDIIGQRLPLQRHEVPSGTQVFDWQVPDEWNIRDAYVADAGGRRVIDFRESNLHVVSYSIPIRARLPLRELREHLHSLPNAPDWIPYRTSYYRRSWGFCLRHRDLEALPDGDYDVCIDATLAPGSLTYAECVLPGAVADEIVVFSHICHPSLANDNAAGIAVAVELAEALGRSARHYTWRFVFAPGTIGAITWLARNDGVIRRIAHGLVTGLLGDGGGITYKRSAQGDAAIDRAATSVLRTLAVRHSVEDFSPYGYDERQFNSPGINLPVGRLTRSPNGGYPEYHTSADSPDILSAEQLAESLWVLARLAEVLETNTTVRNLMPFCEPQLGRRGLYRSTGGEAPRQREHALLWVLNQADGNRSLLDISERSGIPFSVIRSAAEDLAVVGLLGA